MQESGSGVTSCIVFNMPKTLPFWDYRRRLVMRDSEFGSIRGQGKRVTDLVTRKTWRSLTLLPDDVSVFTSSHFGGPLTPLATWGSDLVFIGSSALGALQLDDSPIGSALFDSSDDYSAGVYNALVGYYRSAHSCLRNCLEHLSQGLEFELSGSTSRFQAWLGGGSQIHFNDVLDQLSKRPLVAAFEAPILAAVGDTLFKPRSKAAPGGIASKVYCELCRFTHGQGGSTHAAIWQSNGPVFSADALDSFARFAAWSVAFACVCTQLARPGVHIESDEGASLGEVFEHAAGSLGSARQSWDAAFAAIPKAFWV